MTKLTIVLTEQKSFTTQTGDETRTAITVDYDHTTHSVDLILIEVTTQRFFKYDNVVSYSPMSTSSDITYLVDQMPSMMKDIEAMDWETEYHRYKQERRVVT